MWPVATIEVYPVVDDALGCEAVGDVLQVDGFVFERAPETFDEDVVHGEADLRLGEGDFAQVIANRAGI